MRPNMDQHQLFDSRLLGHLRRPHGPTLPGVLAVLVHNLLVVPTHAEPHIRALGQISDSGAGLGVAGKDHASICCIHPVSQQVFVNRGGTLPRTPPSVAAKDVGPGPVFGGRDWQVTAAPAEHVQPWLDSLAYRVDTADGSVVFTGDTLGDGLGESRPEDLKLGDELIMFETWEGRDPADPLLDAVRDVQARMPDAAKRERQTENIFKGIESRFFRAAVHRFDRMLTDMEADLAQAAWLAGAEFSLADIAYTPYAVRLDHLQLQGMWDKRPRFADWYHRAAQRPAFKIAITDWINPGYLEIMAPKGRETWPRIHDILATN